LGLGLQNEDAWGISEPGWADYGFARDKAVMIATVLILWAETSSLMSLRRDVRPCVIPFQSIANGLVRVIAGFVEFPLSVEAKYAGENERNSIHIAVKGQSRRSTDCVQVKF
jgi:hypothetical protein